MFNRQSFENLSVSGAIVLAWVFFTTLYTFFSLAYPLVVTRTQNAALMNAQQQGYNVAVNQAMQTFSGNVFQNGYNKAVVDLALALDTQVQGGCKEAVPVTIGTGAIGVVNIACIQQANGQTQNGTGTSTPPPSPVPTPQR